MHSQIIQELKFSCHASVTNFLERAITLPPQIPYIKMYSNFPDRSSVQKLVIYYTIEKFIFLFRDTFIFVSLESSYQKEKRTYSIYVSI